MKQKFLLITCVLLIANISTIHAEKVSPTTRGAVITSSQSASVQQNMEQVALVIGNNDYEFSPLENAVNDATKVAGVLKQKGFKVILKTNLTYARMKEAVREFENELAAKRDVGLLFYAGHGVQIKGENFLIPVNNQEMRDEMDVQDKAINVDDIALRMRQSKVKLSVVILDACRDNPFKPTAARSRSMGMTRGLTPMQAAEGMVIAYATDPGSTASDGDGGQGLYTKHLIKALQTPNLQIEDVFKQVRREVKEASGGKQVPWFNTSVDGHFCFGGCQDQIKIMEEQIKATAVAAEQERIRIAAEKAAAANDAKNKQKQQLAEQQRIAAEKAAAAKEAESKQKQQLAEQKRIEAEKAVAAKEAESKQKQQLAEQQRIAAGKAAAAKEAESKQKQQLAEQQRIAAGKAAVAKVAESKQKQQLAEQQRIAAEKAAVAKEAESKQKQQLVEQQRIEAEKAAAAEETEGSKPEATKPQPTVSNSTPLPPVEPPSPELVEPAPEVAVKPQKSRGLEVPTGGF
jgi:uncharacterized caspase-like protein